MLELIADSPDFIVVNKPINVSMHLASSSKCDSAIIPLACEQFGIDKLWLVHRLDDGTSGCLLLAKNKTAASNLSKLFESRSIQKYYLALIDQKPKKKQGKVMGDMQKSRNGSWKLTKSMENPAITQFFSFVYNNEHDLPNATKMREAIDSKPMLRICMLKPLTGKTHQLRVALKSIGSAIVGDTRYKGSRSDRMYLHAYSLAFEYQDMSYHISALPNEGEYFCRETITNSLKKNSEPWQQKWPNVTKSNEIPTKAHQ